MSRPKVYLLVPGEHTDHEDVPGLRLGISPLTSSSILIHGVAVTVFDAGAPKYRPRILERLRECGMRPEDVQYLILSHLHLDHAMNWELYPYARVVSEPNVQLVHYWERCEVLDEPITHPDWEIVPTPGHTAVHLSLLVRGMWEGTETQVVLAGDAFREDRWRSGHYHDASANPSERESAEWILNHAEVIIPGHGRVLDTAAIRELHALTPSP